MFDFHLLNFKTVYISVIIAKLSFSVVIGRSSESANLDKVVTPRNYFKYL